MNTKEAVQSLPEYVNVPPAELVESPTNPRKTFDDETLEELAASIRSKPRSGRVCRRFSS
jgi:hypothetical protein